MEIRNRKKKDKMSKDKATFIILIFIVITSCNLLKANKTKHIANFNITDFNTNSINGQRNFINHNGDYVQQFTSTSEASNFVERRRFKNSSYGIYSEFANDGHLLREGNTFYDYFIGTHHFFDKSGNVIKTENLDQGFQFSIAQLIQKFKTDYHLDLSTRQNEILVVRQFDPPTYKVYVREKNYLMNRRVIIIDGNDGGVNLDTTITLLK
jgi:hypothetical protein